MSWIKLKKVHLVPSSLCQNILYCSDLIWKHRKMVIHYSSYLESWTRVYVYRRAKPKMILLSSSHGYIQHASALSSTAKIGPIEFQNQHALPIRSLAFSPVDGRPHPVSGSMGCAHIFTSRVKCFSFYYLVTSPLPLECKKSYICILTENLWINCKLWFQNRPINERNQ